MLNLATPLATIAALLSTPSARAAGTADLPDKAALSQRRMFRRGRAAGRRVGGWTLSVALLIGMGVPATSDAVAVRGDAGFTTNTLPANDDDSTGLVPLGFSIDYFGLSFTDVYVNNNGNVTFDAQLAEFTPFDLTATGRQILAPFFADVDTRGSGSGVVTYGTATINGHAAFGINWIDVGYFSSKVDKLNSFQLVIIDRSDIDPGDFDFEFNYDRIEWETGGASGGVGGLGGSSARAGYSNGTGVAGTFLELPGSAVNGGLLDTNPATGLALNSNVGVPGRFLFLVRSGVVTLCGDGILDSSEDCDDGNLVDGDCCSATCLFETGACEDGNLCTDGDICDGEGTCLPGGPFDCDDADACTVDSCDPSDGSCINDGTPALTCLASPKASFQVRDNADDAKDQIKWRWSGGGEVMQADLGAPETTTTYTLCVYDSTASADALVAKLQVDPNTNWDDKDPKGLKYKDSAGTEDGVTKAQLKTGAAGKSKAQVGAKGLNIPMPTPLSTTEFFDQDTKVTVQLVNDETSLCWTSEFTTATKNDAVQFKAKAP